MSELDMAIRDLTIRHDKRVTLEIERLHLIGPALVAVVGPNGSGKSTFLRAVAGLARLSTGTVEVGGAPASSKEAQRRATYVPDQPVLFDDLTVRDNMTYAADNGTAEVAEIATTLVERFATAHLLGRFPRQLSLGQRHIAALVVGLAQISPVLLLDEPTTALDENRRSTLIQHLKAEATQRLVVVSTHEQSLISNADQLVRLTPDGHLTDESQ